MNEVMHYSLVGHLILIVGVRLSFSKKKMIEGVIATNTMSLMCHWPACSKNQFKELQSIGRFFYSRKVGPMFDLPLSIEKIEKLSAYSCFDW